MKNQTSDLERKSMTGISSYKEFLKNYQPSNDSDWQQGPDTEYIWDLKQRLNLEEVLNLITNDEDFKKCDDYSDWVDSIEEEYSDELMLISESYSNALVGSEDAFNTLKDTIFNHEEATNGNTPNYKKLILKQTEALRNEKRQEVEELLKWRGGIASLTEEEKIQFELFIDSDPY